jgi:hypothetical protein
MKIQKTAEGLDVVTYIVQMKVVIFSYRLL